MRKTPWRWAEKYRKTHPLGDAPYGADYGYFAIPSPRGVVLHCIVSAGIPEEGEEIYKWEHVSVSLPNRCPT